MALSLSEIQREALKLTVEERAKLAETMLETLQENYPDIEAAWQGEVAERVAAYEQGDKSTYTADEVFSEAHRIGK